MISNILVSMRELVYVATGSLQRTKITSILRYPTTKRVLVCLFSSLAILLRWFNHLTNFDYLYFVVIETASIGCGRGYRNYFELLRTFIQIPAEYSARK
jgi:hypothetical protein